MFEVPKFVLYVVAWFSVIGGIWALFDRLETVLRDDLRNQISAWLNNDTNFTEARTWPAIFASIFDLVFGDQHMSWKCFVRSSLASIFAVGVMVLIVTSTVDDIWDDTYFWLIGWKAGVPLFILVTILINPIPDYISLLETRLLIRYMAAHQRVSHYFMAIIVDLLLTAIIFTIAVTSGFAFYYWIFDEQVLVRIHDNIVYMPERISGIIFPWRSTYHTFSTVWLYSTFFTSIWMWLFLLSSFFAKGLHLIGISLRYLGRFLDTENKPLRSLGYISMLIATLGFIVFPFL